MTHRSTWALALLLLCLAACKSTPKPLWTSEILEVRSERTLWDVLRESLDRAGFAVGIGADPSARKIESAWKVDTSPFKSQGWRKKAHVEYSPDPSGEGRWDVRVRIQMDTNESFSGLDLRYAEWKPTNDDEATSQRVMQFARSMLGGGVFEVGPAIRAPGGPEQRGRTRPNVIPELQLAP